MEDEKVGCDNGGRGGGGGGGRSPSSKRVYGIERGREVGWSKVFLSHHDTHDPNSDRSDITGCVPRVFGIGFLPTSKEVDARLGDFVGPRSARQKI